MKKFWNQSIEFKSLIISLIATVLAFSGTAILFWFQRYDIPLAVLTSGMVVSLTWLLLYINKKRERPSVKLDIIAIFLRLTLIVLLAILFTVLDITLSLVIISPLFLVISYLGYSLLNLLAYIRKDTNV